jgi:5-oxoprolinase (ATP-hydrolysing)
MESSQTFKSAQIRFAIDRGGTFTDVYAEIPESPGFMVEKLLSENPEKYSDAPIEGIRRIMERLGKPFESISSIEWIRMGTTLATNALLERKGVRSAVVITKGFKDLLRIGKQNRPNIFDLKIQIPEPFYEKVVEVNERVRLLQPEEDKGNSYLSQIGRFYKIIQHLDLDRLKSDLLEIKREGITSIAVVCIHSYAFPKHELEIEKIAKEIGFSNIALSHLVSPKVKLVDRGQTASVEAYLNPIIQKYVKEFRSKFQDEALSIWFMQSDGGLVGPDRFSGSRSIYSGPAGGVVGYALTGRNRYPEKPLIGFDMGGTSTDVSRFDGEFEWMDESEISAVHLQTPHLKIKTIAAGGGSRLYFKNGLFVVGPGSAGADPGPVCYGKDGFAALTDANLILGRLLPDHFPNIFGPNADQPLDKEAARSAMIQIVETVNEHNVKKEIRLYSVEEVAAGFVQVVNEAMARAIREVTSEKGFDVSDHILACFGGAGGQHACAVAKILGIEKIFVHRFAGILSAFGMGLADVFEEIRQPVAYKLKDLSRLLADIERLRVEAGAIIKEQGFSENQIEVQTYLVLRYQDTDTSKALLFSESKNIKEKFLNWHSREMGFQLEDREVLIDEIVVRAIGHSSNIVQRKIPLSSGSSKPISTVDCFFDNEWKPTPIFQLRAMRVDEKISGPAVIIDSSSTIVIDPFCSAVITEFGDIEINVSKASEDIYDSAENPVLLSLYGHRFMAIAEQMGRILEKTATSTNIKERRDFSCAIFDGKGNLVANAPHLPVHLGAMGETVRKLVEFYGNDIKEGDVWLSNHPEMGGSHLPDITVVTPIFYNGIPKFYTANRGHHSDVGGISPGSMPPFSTRLEDEGIAIKFFKLVKNGFFREGEISQILSGSTNTLGTRALKDNISDLKAQVAANRRGKELLEKLIEGSSFEAVCNYMELIQKNSSDSVRSLLKNWTGVNDSKSVEHMDDGSKISLHLKIDKKSGSAVFDFTETTSQVKENFNAPKAVTFSAILYCLRCLIQEEVPLNEGFLIPIKILIPQGSILNPMDGAAVCGGNVLTSQRITDVILKSFRALAGSQGCMNNLTFGSDKFGYYETIGGGAGAGPGWNGWSGVHTHMTNTRITDPEILELRYPVLLREFSYRLGSGGKGKYCGGDGLIREIEFLSPMNVAILSERRVYSPYGLNGGENGEVGKNLWVSSSGNVEDLGGKNQKIAKTGDAIRILTPGGGGYGSE